MTSISNRGKHILEIANFRFAIGFLREASHKICYVQRMDSNIHIERLALSLSLEQKQKAAGCSLLNKDLPIKFTLLTNSSNTSFSFNISIGSGGSSVFKGPSGTGAHPIFHTRGRVRA